MSELTAYPAGTRCTLREFGREFAIVQIGGHAPRRVALEILEAA